MSRHPCAPAAALICIRCHHTTGQETLAIAADKVAQKGISGCVERHISDAAIRVSRTGRWFAAPAVSSTTSIRRALLEAAFLRSPAAHGLIRSIDTQRGAGAARRARGLYARRSAPGPDRRPLAAAISKLRAAAGYFAVHSGGQGGFICRRGDCAGRGGQALYRRGRAGADRDGHSGTAGRLGLPRRAVGAARPTCTSTARAIC